MNAPAPVRYTGPCAIFICINSISVACSMFHTHALGMVVVGAPPVRPVQGGAVRSTSAEPIATHSPPVPFRMSCSNTDTVAPCPTARWG